MESVFSGIADLCFPILDYNHLSSSRLQVGTIFMTTYEEASFIAVCFEGFFYGKISVSCAFNLYYPC